MTSPKRDRDLDNARVSAARRLAQRYPAEFKALLIEELAKRLDKKSRTN